MPTWPTPEGPHNGIVPPYGHIFGEKKKRKEKKYFGKKFSRSATNFLCGYNLLAWFLVLDHQLLETI